MEGEGEGEGEGEAEAEAEAEGWVRTCAEACCSFAACAAPCGGKSGIGSGGCGCDCGCGCSAPFAPARP